MSPKLILLIIAIACIGLGAVWILQGMNILPGSFMSGHTVWARNGAILAGIGAVLLVVAVRK
jgi:amino acid permease